jgi:hypothetical protein
MSQMSRTLTDASDGFLTGKRFLIHDRDPLFTLAFRETLAAVGVEVVRLPPRSPNLRAYAERFVRTIEESCLDPLILVGEGSLFNSSARWGAMGLVATFIRDKRRNIQKENDSRVSNMEQTLEVRFPYRYSSGYGVAGLCDSKNGNSGRTRSTANDNQVRKQDRWIGSPFEQQGT